MFPVSMFGEILFSPLSPVFDFMFQISGFRIQFPVFSFQISELGLRFGILLLGELNWELGAGGTAGRDTEGTELGHGQYQPFKKLNKNLLR